MHKMKGFLALGLAIFLTVSIQIGRETLRSEAATSQLSVSQSCAGGSANVTFSWQGNDQSAQQQWIDLSSQDNGFAAGTFISAGPFSGSTASFTWNGLITSTLHYVRVNQQLSDGRWDPSGAFQVTTNACTVPTQVSAPPPSQSPNAADNALVGCWQGKWGGQNDSKLNVTSATSSQVSATYTFMGQSSPMSLQVQSDGTLTYSSNSISFLWSLSSDGRTLSGSRTQNGQPAGQVSMTRGC